METFHEYQKEVSSLKKASIKESKQHNKEIKKIEQMKANTAKLESKSKELVYKQELITVYENFQNGYE